MVKRNWMGVVSAEHVRRGVTGGFAQVCHGRQAPLNRMQSGDGMVYYSPSEVMQVKDGLQSFTAIGHVGNTASYQVEQFPGFTPWRRDIEWLAAEPQPIKPLLDWLDFTQGPNWGYSLRFGIIELSQSDFDFLLHVMTKQVLPA